MIGDFFYFGETKRSIDLESEEGHKLAGEEPNGVALSALEDMIAHVISQTTTEEEEYLEEQNIQKQVVNQSFEPLEIF